MNCTLKYNAKGCLSEARNLKLTVISDNEDGHSGLAGVRRERLLRMVAEARLQGGRLTYADLSMIMLASRSTLKRDVVFLRGVGHDLSIGRDVQDGRV